MVAIATTLGWANAQQAPQREVVNIRTNADMGKTNHPPSAILVTPSKNANGAASCLWSTCPLIAIEGSHCTHDPNCLKLRYLKGVLSRSIDKFGLNAYELGKESFPYIHGVIDLYIDMDNAVIYMDGKEPFLHSLLCAGETGAVSVTMGGQGSASVNNVTPEV